MATNVTEKKKRTTYTTPKGESLFAHLVNVDYGTEQYPDEKGSFNVTLALDAAAKLDSLIAHEVDTARAEAEEKFDGLKPQTKKKFGSVNFNEVGPEEYDREGNPTGRRLFRFKTGAFYENRQGVKVQRKVPLFDSARRTRQRLRHPCRLLLRALLRRGAGHGRTLALPERRADHQAEHVRRTLRLRLWLRCGRRRVHVRRHG